MGEKEKDQPKLEVEEEADQDSLEKALDSAIESLSGKKGKGKKKPAKEDEEDDDYYEVDEKDEDEPEEEEEKEEKKPKKRAKKSDDEPNLPSLSKSLDEMIEENDEAAQMMDASPFIKAMVQGVESQLTDFAKSILYLGEKIESIEKLIAAGQKLEVAQAKMVKSISSEMKKIGDVPMPKKAFLGKNLEIVRKAADGSESKMEMTKSDALTKLTELHKAGKLELKDVTVLEARINNGHPIPDRYLPLFTEKVS